MMPMVLPQTSFALFEGLEALLGLNPRLAPGATIYRPLRGLGLIAYHRPSSIVHRPPSNRSLLPAEAVLNGEAGGPSAGGHAYLGVNAVEVGVYGADADAQLLGDLGVS